MYGIAPDKIDQGKVGEISKIELERLLGSKREVIIVHAGDEYHLRLTSNNKLILTK
jgi:hemin uptake protein HemP